MSDEEHIDSVVREADEWLNSHRVSETWRTMNRLRDTLVRTPPQNLTSGLGVLAWADEALDWVKRALVFPT